jgi:carbonic anhydrase/acetyltransferase-like protein (isoleucine patch superfamily)
MEKRSMIRPYCGKAPRIETGSIVFETASVIGDVTIGTEVGIWPGAVLRGDCARIEVGSGTSIQDNSVVHVSVDVPTLIGKDVTIGHGAILHGCTIEDGCLIGMGAIVLDGAVVGRNSIVGAGALVTKGTGIPERSMVLGSPAKVVRQLTGAEIEDIYGYVERYKGYTRQYIRENKAGAGFGDSDFRPEQGKVRGRQP